MLYGAEATGAWRPDPCGCEGMEFFGALGTTMSTDQGVVPDTPFHGRAGARYSQCVDEPCGLRRWYIEASLRGSEDSAHQGVGGHDFVTADFLTGFGIARGGHRKIDFTFGVANLFDASYVEPFARLEAPGRSLFASLSFDF